MADASPSAQPEFHPGAIERRAAVRYACVLETACRSLAGSADVRWPARVRDISATGICLLVSRRFEPGSLLAIDLSSDFASAPLARVVRVNWQADGDWALGCAFVTRLSDEELRTLLE
jgi:hypothetical protein